tara:strand:+ start:319 stop:621 length:303 start_codon:yes stop_codon:yes gene_type:complete
MIVPIDEKYRIATDEHCWMIQRLKHVRSGKHAGQKIWESIRFYPDITSTVGGLYELQIRASTAETFGGALADSKRIVTRLVTALNPQFEVSVSPHIEGDE